MQNRRSAVAALCFVRPALVAVMLGTAVLSSGLGARAAGSDRPSGTFESATVEHNVVQNGVKGMKIHATFTTFGEKGRACRIVAYFMFDNGTRLVGRTPQYLAADGQVAVWSTYTPEFDHVIFKDYVLFMPYGDLNMRPGSYKLKFHVTLCTQESKMFFAKSRYLHFTYTETA